MKTTNLETDAKTYRSSYAAEGGYNAVMEIKAIEQGLEIDEHTILPWDWILRAAATSLVLKNTEAVVSGECEA
jgi:hypothetical protein